MTREVDRNGLKEKVGERALTGFNQKPSIVNTKPFQLKD